MRFSCEFGSPWLLQDYIELGLFKLEESLFEGISQQDEGETFDIELADRTSEYARQKKAQLELDSEQADFKPTPSLLARKRFAREIRKSIPDIYRKLEL
ncbi:hypothetical protein ABW20_dc0103834 [Dactylellina cionopaga]|nr:hypothetical protein ABW20_dc0103834 [Dactylellina cionopaga]